MTGIQTFNVEIEGLVPIVMHNGQLCDPFNYYAKELKKLTSKKTKTEDDLRQMMRVEWDGSLYLDGEGRVAMPADNVLAMIQAGARKFRLGPQVEPGVFLDSNWCEFSYDGPKDLDKLYEDSRFVFRKRAVFESKKGL